MFCFHISRFYYNVYIHNKKCLFHATLKNIYYRKKIDTEHWQNLLQLLFSNTIYTRNNRAERQKWFVFDRCCVPSIQKIPQEHPVVILLHAGVPLTSTIVLRHNVIGDSIPQPSLIVYPVPHIPDFASGIQGSRIFSKIDLNKTYYSDIPKNAFTTPFGLYEFVKMPFGLRKAAQTFQSLIDEVLRGLYVAYDILRASDDINIHKKKHLHEVFQKLSHFVLQLNLNKRVFDLPCINFLGVEKWNYEWSKWILSDIPYPLSSISL